MNTVFDRLNQIALLGAAILTVLIFVGCARTYHIYNIVDNGSTMSQTITVTATVPKTVDINTDIVPGLP